MNKRIISLSILVLSTLLGISCWDFGYEENKYVTPFDENVLVAPDLMPFLFSNHQYHWGKKNTDSSIASNSERWANHFHQKYSVKNIDQICYDFSQKEFESALNLSHPDTFNNPLITDFRHGKHAFELKYLKLAHQASSVSAYPDIWEVIWNERYPSLYNDVPSDSAASVTIVDMATDSTAAATNDMVVEPTTTDNHSIELEEQNQLAREKFIEDSMKLAFQNEQFRLIHLFKKLQKETTNPELLERIYFQQIKLAFYLGFKEDKIEALFQKAYPNPKPHSIFYWDALEHLAGSRENEQQKALEFAQIFDAMPSFRKGAIAGFPELSDDTWDQTLHCASTPQQKATLWAMLAYQQPEITAYAFEQIHDLAPTSKYADLLLVRQIQLLEFGIHAHEISVGTYPYSGAIEYQFQGEEFKNQVEDFAFRVHERFRKNKTILTETQHLCWAYLQHLAGNEETALKIISQFNPKSKEIARQALVFKILAQQKINYQKPWSPELDQQTVQDLKQLSNFPNFKNICQKTPTNIWDHDTISDESITFDNKQFEGIEDYGYASLRDGFRIYLLHYMEKIQGDESYQNQEPLTHRNASQTLAQWFLDAGFKVYDYPEIWGATEMVHLLDSPDQQSLTDRWLLHHIPQEISYNYIDKNYNYIDYTIPINRDFWCEIAGELALQRHEFSDAETFLSSIKHPEKYPRLQLENNPTTFGAQNLDSLLLLEFGSKPITNKAELAQTLNHLSYFVEREEANPKKLEEKKAIAHWLLAHLLFNISYDGNCWNASRFAWSSYDPEYFSEENRDQCLLSVVPDHHYFDLSPVREHLHAALQFFNKHPRKKELLAGLLITKIQFDYFNFYSPIYTNWRYTLNEANNSFNQSSGIDLQRLKSNFNKTKTYQKFIQNCPEFEYYATN